MLGLESSRGESFEEHEELRFGDDSISLQIKGLHILSRFLSRKSSGFIELHVELIEEGVQFVDIKSPTFVSIILIEHLVDEHSENIVVQS